MSMGASGTWHLGLKHPDRFVALGPYCGYVDTHQFSRDAAAELREGRRRCRRTRRRRCTCSTRSTTPPTPASCRPSPAWARRTSSSRPTCSWAEAMEKEGLKMVNLISPGTGHVIDPVTHKEQMRRIGEYRGEGAGPCAEAHPLRHLDAEVQPLPLAPGPGPGGALRPRRAGGATSPTTASIEVKEPKNVTRFAIRPPVPRRQGARLRVGGRDVGAAAARGRRAPAIVFGRRRRRQMGRTSASSTPCD